MVKELRSIIEQVIAIKMDEIRELDFEDMKADLKVKHEEACNKSLVLYKNLKETLTGEQLKILIDLSYAETLVSVLEQEHMFNQGVMIGLSELKFIEKELRYSDMVLLETQEEKLKAAYAQTQSAIA